MQHSIFAMEVCVRVDRAPWLLGRLRQRIAEHPASASHQAKWAFYRACASDLHAALGDTERGCWDFFDDDARAQRDYSMWVNGMLTKEGARTEPSARVASPYRDLEPRYMTFTMSFFLVQGSPSERALASLCDVPESFLWHRGTFARILKGLGCVSFASVKSDVVYLIPRDGDWTLTTDDLAHPKFEYLRPLV